MSNPFISICIPAYKNKEFLERLLDSIKIQSYRNFEVVITDDSPDNEIQLLCKKYQSQFQLEYYKNTINLNTPENWNESIRKAKYDWIKIMHDDDWFNDEFSLGHYAKAIQDHQDINFFFSAYQNVYIDSGREEIMKLPFVWKCFLRKNPEVLISRNIIGPPSACLYKKTKLEYDKAMKYVVDIDFYANYLKEAKWHYLPQVLIQVGIHGSQVTKYTFGFSEFHLHESILMLQKKDDRIFRNAVVFDGWWRLIRNFNVRSISIFNSFRISYTQKRAIQLMIKAQSTFPKQLLQIGAFSKILMSFSFLRFKIRFSK